MTNINDKQRTFIENLKVVQLKRKEFMDALKFLEAQRIPELCSVTQSVFKTKNNKILMAKKTKGHKISNFNTDYIYFISKNTVDLNKILE